MVPATEPPAVEEGSSRRPVVEIPAAEVDSIEYCLSVRVV